MKTRKIMTFVSSNTSNDWFITPCIGVIDERGYYGYPVFAIAFGWLKFRCKVVFGIKKLVRDNG